MSDRSDRPVTVSALLRAALAELEGGSVLPLRAAALRLGVWGTPISRKATELVASMSELGGHLRRCVTLAQRLDAALASAERTEAQERVETGGEP